MESLVIPKEEKVDSPWLIDKSKIIISQHAIERFFSRSQNASIEMMEKGWSEENITHQLGTPIPENLEEARYCIITLLHMSDHRKASTELDRLNEIYKRIGVERMERLFGRPKGKQPACFFRYKRWQFIVIQDREDPTKFVLTTVIWINDEKYGQLMS